MTEPARRYVFSPLERRGLLLGLTPPQLAALAGPVAVAVVVVHVAPDAIGILVGISLIVTGVAAACLPIAGRAPVVWLPVVLGWCRRRISGPVTVRPAWAGARSCATLDDSIEVVSVPAVPGQPDMGVVHDRANGTWASVVPVRGRAFALLDPLDKERRLSAWGGVLAAMARTGTPVHRLQWVERSFAGDGDALQRHLLAAAPGTTTPGPPTSCAATAVAEARGGYEELIAAAGPATLEHESLVVIAVHPRRAARSLRSFGHGRRAICGLLQRETRLFQGQLRAAELWAGEALDTAGLSSALRAGFDPGVRRRTWVRGTGPGGAWPLASDEAWSSLRLDGAWFATYWVAEWPRIEVGPDFLAPLLLAGARRTVSLTLGPVPPDRARREVEAARTADAADEELRRRAGFLSTARHRRESEGVAQRESELADGHAEYRFSGYVTVSGADRNELEAACAEIEQAAQQARLEVRRLYGQQREAFCWTLPLARGLG
jgi:hypothetical protein